MIALLDERFYGPAVPGVFRGSGMISRSVTVKYRRKIAGFWKEEQMDKRVKQNQKNIIYRKIYYRTI